MRQVRVKGLALVGWVFTLGMVAYDIVRMRRLFVPRLTARGAWHSVNDRDTEEL
jgi:hypothetical protein